MTGLTPREEADLKAAGLLPPEGLLAIRDAAQVLAERGGVVDNALAKMFLGAATCVAKVPALTEMAWHMRVGYTDDLQIVLGGVDKGGVRVVASNFEQVLAAAEAVLAEYGPPATEEVD